MKLPHLLATALACAALASCAQTPPATPSTTPPEAESVRLDRELRALIGPASCSTDAQCRTVAVGAKACGGPAGYWAWSTQGTDAEALTALAARQTEAQRREVASSGMRSNCSIVSDPGAACVAGRCQVQGPASAR
jgi:hypothetical protein